MTAAATIGLIARTAGVTLLRAPKTKASEGIEIAAEETAKCEIEAALEIGKAEVAMI